MSEIIANRRHLRLEEKAGIHKLLSDSYRGGETYKKGDHLWHYSTREPKAQFDDRLKRAIYINLIRPILDILSSFIFNEDQTREYPKSLEFIKDSIGGQKNVESFMRNLSIHSGLYTVGVLVDSPSQDKLEGITNLKSQIESGLKPYAKTYMPWQVRDFDTDDTGELLWVLVDDTEINKSDPLNEPSKRIVYTLWDKKTFRKYEILTKEKDGLKEAILLTEESGTHPIGYVPFRFVNWNDIDDDLIADTPFETAAIIARQIYNIISYLDEMLAAGTFKHLFYPAKKESDIPESFKQNGVSSSVVTNYNPDNGGKPFFDGASLNEVPPYLQSVEFYEKRIMSIFGMDEDRDKKFVQSGTAKSLEFSKSETMLRGASKSLEDAEKWIVKTIGKWMGMSDTELDIKIEYQRQFQSEEIEQQITRLFQVVMSPYESANKAAWSEIIRKVLSNLDNKEMEKILKEIESGTKPVDIDALIKDETHARGDTPANTPAVGENAARS